jgi:hypothetical protein
MNGEKRENAPRSAIILVCLCSLFVPFSLARAALDPETDKPYQLQIVLRIADNRLLTPTFRETVARQLRDSLQADLGDLALVRIVHQHRLLKEIETRGLQAALDNYSDLSDTKTHFVLIDFVNGRYEIQTRQHDGFTGLSSPVVRRSSTADRQVVAHLAALLIDQDFGLAGTVDLERMEAGNTEAKVDIQLKGGALGVPLDRWLKKDQVFAVSLIPPGPAPHSIRMSWTLLQVAEEPHGARCRCRLLSRWDDPLPRRAAGVLGYRCLKLGTTRAPLRLRVVKDDKLKTPLSGVQVVIRTRGFTGTSGLDAEAVTTKIDGLVQSQQEYQNVAFVRIFEGQLTLARAPVEIIQGLTITCPVSVNPELVAQEELLDRRRRWLSLLADNLAIANYLTKELNHMAGESSERRLARAQEGLKVLQTAIGDLTLQHDELRAASAGEATKTMPLDLKEGEERLKDLQDQGNDLQQYIRQLQEIIDKEKDPRRRQWREMLAEANRREREAEFDKAIALYQQVLEKSGDIPDLRRHLDALKNAWAVKSEAHAKARDFIYHVWPKQQKAAQMKARLDEARNAFQVCKEAGDSLSPQMLLKTFAEHTRQLDQEVDALHPDQKEDDLKTTQTIIDLTKELKKFNDEVKEYLAKAKPLGK